MKSTVFLCVEGDLRQAYVCESLRAFGNVYIIGKDGAVPENMPEKADVLVLPMMTGEEYDIDPAMVTSHLISGGLVLGGRLSHGQKKLFSDMGFSAEDYFLRESLALKNAVPTAEGTLMTVMANTTGTVYQSRILVLGYGRTGKSCARLFSAAGADCTVAARRPEILAQAWSEGHHTVHLSDIANSADSFDTIINTVPAVVLTEEILSCVQKNCLIVDLASMPGGTDFFAAERLGIKAIHALALPAKAAPAASGRYIAETIIEMLEERGMTNC